MKDIWKVEKGIEWRDKRNENKICLVSEMLFIQIVMIASSRKLERIKNKNENASNWFYLDLNGNNMIGYYEKQEIDPKNV